MNPFSIIFPVAVFPLLLFRPLLWLLLFNRLALALALTPLTPQPPD